MLCDVMLCDVMLPVHCGLCWQGGETGYRAAVVKAIPHLKVLDDVSVTEQPSPRPSPLSTGLSSQSIGFGRLGSSWGGERSEPHDRGLSGLACQDSQCAVQAMSCVCVCARAVSPLPARPRTALSPGRGGRVSPVEDDSSELTHGEYTSHCYSLLHSAP